MGDTPPFSRTDTARSGQPLLYTPVSAHDEDDDPRAYGGSHRRPSPIPSPTSRSPFRPRSHAASPARTTPTHAHFPRTRTMRSRSPSTTARLAARRKYTYAAIFLAVSLVAFTVQTELAAYIQKDLGWDKAYCMLYLTHGSWTFLWPAQLAVLRLRQRDVPWAAFWRRHVWLLRTTGQMVERQDVELPRGPYARSPVPYLIKTTVFITVSLTVAGLSWYVAVNMTTPSDLTAIYNCSAFFAYAFSVPLLKEKLRLGKSLAVAIAIIGVFAIAYGDTDDAAAPGPGDGDTPTEPDGASRSLGNFVIGIGSVLYGLYEVLYKRFACPPEGTSPGRGMIFANAFGSLIGLFTLTVLWIPLPVLHVLGWETFEMPTGRTAWLLFLSVVMNATFSGSFLVLISLTGPVLSSVAGLLTIFLVAVADWLWTGKPLHAPALFGGTLIICAFAMLSVSTWREMAEEERKKEVDLRDSDDEED